MHLHTNHLVILLVNDLANWSRSEVACGANIAARRLGYRLVCLDWHGEHQWEQEYLATILSTRPCGVLFLCPFETQNLPLCQKVAASVPTVQVLLPHPEISSDIVAIDNYAGASVSGRSGHRGWRFCFQCSHCGSDLEISHRELGYRWARVQRHG